jgi:hypothetical protein
MTSTVDRNACFAINILPPKLFFRLPGPPIDKATEIQIAKSFQNGIAE